MPASNVNSTHAATRRQRRALRWIFLASLTYGTVVAGGCGHDLVGSLYSGTLTYITGQVSSSFSLFSTQLNDLIVNGLFDPNSMLGGGSTQQQQ